MTLPLLFEATLKAGHFFCKPQPRLGFTCHRNSFAIGGGAIRPPFAFCPRNSARAETQTKTRKTKIMQLAVTVENQTETLKLAEVRTKAGNLSKYRFSFVGDSSFASIRAELKAQGLKGKKLSQAVEKRFRDNAKCARSLTMAAIQASFDDGAIPEKMELNKSGTVQTFTLRNIGGGTEDSTVSKKNATALEMAKEAYAKAVEEKNEGLVEFFANQIAVLAE